MIVLKLILLYFLIGICYWFVNDLFGFKTKLGRSIVVEYGQKKHPEYTKEQIEDILNRVTFLDILKGTMSLVITWPVEVFGIIKSIFKLVFNLIGIFADMFKRMIRIMKGYINESNM